ncbi:DUF1801 domain-containing protein [Cohnella sp. REN36]|uniref:DUF1801 domain-containing protein n=1 Tax=Cohnella sp. REN36 TaxID=2887347 RepID=UPI001D14051D|nr:DUF1801 domain-containing protein [Cohnella sp. REN36]
MDNVNKREDAYRLLDLFTETTGYPAKMWGPSIVGFGSYHYKYESGHEGDAPLVGFSPRKARISLYFATGDPEREALLQKFGKHQAGKGCVYINRLADIDVTCAPLRNVKRRSFFQSGSPSNSPTEISSALAMATTS